ncbi:MAG: DNA primase [Armatimonadetes bacterium]|nr:DNA primase [Armatimonadota bacterium]
MLDERDLVRSRVDLVDLVGERVKLIKVGKKWKGLCPFHTEKTPSFQLDSDLQLFHCFGCKKGGDVFDWVMQSENVDFRTALEMLAQRTGVTLSAGKSRSQGEAQSQIATMEATLAFYITAFTESPSAQEYAATRGLDAETLAKWEIGLAPNSEYALGTHLKKIGCKLQEACELSLLAGDSSAGYRDFFRGRLMFPIRDDQGRLVAFSGRSMDGTEPKYINSRDTALFKKSDTIYGLHHSRIALRESRSAVLAEGQMDVIACHHAGIETAVAALGTALTVGHVRKLKRYCGSATLLYDGDIAGRNAAERAFQLFADVDMSARAVLLQHGEDPDTVRKKEGAEALRQKVASAMSPVRFKVEGLIRDFDAKPGIGDRTFWKAIKEALAGSPEKLEVDALLDELAGLHPNARVDRKAVIRALRSEVATVRKPRSKAGTSAPEAGADAGFSLAMPRGPEREIIRAAIDDEFREFAWPRLAEDDLVVSEGGRAIADALLAVSSEPPVVSARDLVAGLASAVRQTIMTMEPSPLNLPGIEEAIERLVSERERRIRLYKYQSEPSVETAREIYPSSH